MATVPITVQNVGVVGRVKLQFRPISTTVPSEAFPLAVFPADTLQGITPSDIGTRSVVDDQGNVTTIQGVDIRDAIQGVSPDTFGSDTFYPIHIANDGQVFVQYRDKKYYILGYNVKQRVTPDTDTVVFTFYVNPRHITPTYRKSRQQRRTLGGWEIQHWGDELTELMVQGKSGGMHRINEVGRDTGLQPRETVRDSTAWKKLSQLKRIYDLDFTERNVKQATLWSLLYNDKVCVGSFSSFVGPEEDADDPYQLAYQFTFVVDQERTAVLFRKLQ